MAFRKNNPLVKILNSTLVDLPSPANLSVNWNYGSLLGLILVIQLISGIVLATRFSGHSDLSFESVIFIYQDSSYGWLLRLVHATGASFFFLFLYLHIGRGLYYGSYVYSEVWNLGVLIYLVLMGTAFLGYVLPWGQMSYWAATVITNLLSAIPVVGGVLVEWVWGGFAVGNPTLTRFFALHYLLPFIVAVLVVLHLFYLHLQGSSNPLGVASNTNKVPFHYYYSVKDLYVFFVFFFVFLVFSLKYGYVFMDAENFIPANPLVTPTHIQPEWYFLFAYAILRSIPNKLGGVLAMLASIVILFAFTVASHKLLFSGFQFSPFSRFVFWSLVGFFSLLTWLGSCPAEEPYNFVAKFCTFFYFGLMLILCFWSHVVSYFYLWSKATLVSFFSPESQPTKQILKSGFSFLVAWMFAFGTIYHGVSPADFLDVPALSQNLYEATFVYSHNSSAVAMDDVAVARMKVSMGLMQLAQDRRILLRSLFITREELSLKLFDSHLQSYILESSLAYSKHRRLVSKNISKLVALDLGKWAKYVSSVQSVSK